MDGLAKNDIGIHGTAICAGRMLVIIRYEVSE